MTKPENLEKIKKGEKRLKNFMKEQNTILEKWFKKNYGKKCPEYEEGCIVCEQWKLFEWLKYPDEDLK